MFEELKESPWLRHTEPGEVVTMRSRGGIWMWVFSYLSTIGRQSRVLRRGMTCFDLYFSKITLASLWKTD